MKKIINRFVIVILFVFVIVGCATTSNFFTRNQITVNTISSEKVILQNNIPLEQKEVFLQVINTTKQENINLQTWLEKTLRNVGYGLTNDYHNAHYILQVSVFKIGDLPSYQIKNLIEAGFGGATSGNIFPIGLTGKTQNTQACLAVDLQISQRTLPYNEQGNDSHWNRYQTRMVTEVVSGDNSNFDKSKPILLQGMAKAIGNLFIT